jgi:hypothetical protein
MALNFPPQPQTPGTPYEAPNNVTYIWDGVKWIAAGAPGTGNSNLGNLYVIDQTIAGENTSKPITLAQDVTIAGNVILGNIDGFSYHAQQGVNNGGGFTFLDPNTNTQISGLVHANGQNQLWLWHEDHRGVAVNANGTVELNYINSNLLPHGGWTLGDINSNWLEVWTRSLYIDGIARIYRPDNSAQFIIDGTPTITGNTSINNNLTVNGNVNTNTFNLNGSTITAEGDILYVNGVAAVSSAELVNGEYNVTLYSNGNTVFPGTIETTALGVPEFNSSTDININAANRVNITQSPLNLASFQTIYGVHPQIIGENGDIIFDSTGKNAQVYVDGQWFNLVRPDVFNNIVAPAAGTFKRHDGVSVAYIDQIPFDISQLSDNTHLLPEDSNNYAYVNVDGGGAYAIFETEVIAADGGYSSTRFGPSSTVFDGGSLGSGYTNTLNGGVA